MANNVYQMVTDKILSIMAEGKIPWHKPWTGTADGAFNRVSKRPYSLLNQMMLKHSGEYASFKQWKELGGHIKAGSKSEMVVFWKLQQATEVDNDGQEKGKLIPILRYYNVFHISQVDGVEPLADAEKPGADNKPINTIHECLSGYAEREGIALTIGTSNRAFYVPSRDAIVIPALEQFDCSEEFYGTWAHESIHSTMKENRCDRTNDNKTVAFGSTDYSKEELVAEIGSANILNHFGIETEKTIRNSAAYIQSWMKVLKDDPCMIVGASSKAEKATNYILGIEA